MEVLRQIPYAYGVPPRIAELAYEAAEKMDRFPVADFADSTADASSAVAAVPEVESFEEGEGGSSDASNVDLTIEEMQQLLGFSGEDNVTLESLGDLGFADDDGEDEDIDRLLRNNWDENDASEDFIKES